MNFTKGKLFRWLRGLLQRPKASVPNEPRFSGRNSMERSRFDLTYRIIGETRIDGAFTHAFIHNGGTYFLTPISVYQDGVVYYWQYGTFEDFKEAVRRGWVVTQLPERSNVGLFHGRFVAVDTYSWMEPEEFIKEVADVIEELNGRPTTSEFCVKAYNTYQESPTADGLEELRQAYEAVPKHLRVFLLGDMDLKDHPIRTLLEENYGRA